eukprot:TRINITY_DN21525_c0_g1_i1.p1 TRINITY_DN21525_c0_g1~~TRINITY_DN21525_c0_g1_i1.p1  ORF type:complete len:364 (+),score=121.30 TRINITY_DN21525_c0_g1_i1:83-1174(+)
MSQPGEAVFILGRSQVGKSTTIGNMMGDRRQPKPRVGDGDGESCTLNVNTYDTDFGKLVDTPGWPDSKLRFSHDQWAMSVAAAAAAQNARQIKFIICECLSDSAIALCSIGQELVKALGPKVLPGVVILCTMADRVKGEQRELRLSAIRQAAKQCGIPQEIVLWQNKDVDLQGMQHQMKALQDALLRTTGTVPDQLQTITQRAEHRAKQLCRAQETYKKTEALKYREKEAVQRLEDEEYKEAIVQSELKKRRCSVLKSEEVTKTRTVYYTVKEGFSGFFGGNTLQSEEVEYQDTEYRVEEATKDELIPTAKTINKRRQVARFDDKMHDRTKEVGVRSTPRVWQDFMPQAMAEISETVRKEMAP